MPKKKGREKIYVYARQCVFVLIRKPQKHTFDIREMSVFEYPRDSLGLQSIRGLKCH